MSKNKLMEALLKNNKTSIPEEQMKLANEIKSKQKSDDKFDKAQQLLEGIGHSSKNETRIIAPSIKLSLSFPENEMEVIDSILDKFLRQGIRANKSQIVRMAINLLTQTSFEEMIDLYDNLEKRVVGRRLS